MNEECKRYFLLIYLIIHQPMPANFESRKPSCDDILTSENFEKITNSDSQKNSIFYHIFKTGCLVCALPECDYYSSKCEKKWATLGKMPMYNNIFEFGLSGKYLPQDTVVKIHMSKSCHLRMNVFSNVFSKSVVMQLKECPLPNDGCYVERYATMLDSEFNNQYCFYFAVAFYEDNKIHVASSDQCNKFASANFNKSEYYEILEKRCYFEKNWRKPEVEIRFRQESKRLIDGVPVIFPCSPGGFAVDPKTGRFVIDDICLKMFNESKSNEDVGINFLIKYIYNRNENLKFPKRDYRSYTEFRPIFIGADGKVKDRESMSPVHETNTIKGNSKRLTCEYDETVTEDPEDVVTESTLGKTSKPIDTSTYTSTSTQEETTTAVISGKRFKCKELLSLMEKAKSSNLQNRTGDSYDQSAFRGCLICAVTENKNLAVFSLPVYYKLFEFGLTSQYFPKEGTVLVDLNRDCYIKIKVLLESDKVAIMMHECLTFNTSECKTLLVLGNSMQFTLNSRYCLQVGLALHDPTKIYYSFTFECDKFASSGFKETLFVSITQNSCHNRSSQNLKAKFELRQSDKSILDGVPIIVPCSSGGYNVNPETGRFSIRQTCDDMFWETLLDKANTSGIHFVMKNIFKGNGHLLFKRREEVDTLYPNPIYIKANGEAYAIHEIFPKVVPNTDIEKFRQECLLNPQTEVNKEVSSKDSSCGTTVPALCFIKISFIAFVLILN